MIKNGLLQECMKNSFVIKDYDLKELLAYFEIPFNREEEENIDQLQKTKYKFNNKKIARERSEPLKNLFSYVKNKDERNQKIIEAFNDGYMQSEIAEFLNISNSTISKIIKIHNSTPDPL